MKVMTIVGTRPEIIKLSRVMAELDKHVDHVLVHTGQNYDHELNDIFFEQLELRKPDAKLSTACSNPVEAIGNMLWQIDAELTHYKPDAVLILGDTNSCVAATYAAKRRRAPVFHMEAGNRCFDQRVPEEVNRKIVDHISDINMPFTEHSRRNLLAEGIPADRIIKTGSPTLEVLQHYYKEIDASTIRKDLELSEGAYFVVSAHREENVDDHARLMTLVDSVDQLAQYGWPVIWPMHPRTKNRLGEVLPARPNVKVIKPLGLFDYVNLQRAAACVISDSGTLTEESAMLGFPAVTIRQAHERPEGSDEGTLIMSDINAAELLNAVKVTRAQVDTPMRPDGYSAPHVAQKVVRTILSYTSYVRRTVWRQ